MSMKATTFWWWWIASGEQLFQQMWKCITIYLRGLNVELIATSLAGLISSYSYSDASACCTYKHILNKGLGGGFDFYSLSANKLIDNGWMVYMYFILYCLNSFWEIGRN